MSVPVRLTDLRAAAERSDDGLFLTRDELLALVDAVEAAHRVERATPDAAKDHNWWPLLRKALSRFDVGGAAGQPTTTKGQP